MPRFWSAPAAPEHTQTAFGAPNEGPQRAEALTISGADLVFPAPGGGFLLVPVGGGAPVDVRGTIDGQILFWDAVAGRWTVTPTGPAVSNVAQWNGSEWVFRAAPVGSGTIGGQLWYWDGAQWALTPTGPASGDIPSWNGSTYVFSGATSFSGRLLRRSYRVTPAGVELFDHLPGATRCFLRGCGGGAAGGGSAPLAYTGGGCGGSGCYGEISFTIETAQSSFIVGAGGLGVADSEGGDGEDSVWTHNGITRTLPGGVNSSSRIVDGPGSAETALGGNETTGGTNVDLSIVGQRGGSLVRDASNPPLIRSFTAAAGSSPFGYGALPIPILPGGTAPILARNGTSHGSGGSGRCNGADTTAEPGGNGAGGIWIIEEYS